MMNIANYMGATILLVADIPFGETRIGYGVEEFVVDTVIVLRHEYVEGLAPRRYLELVKMRGIPPEERGLRVQHTARRGLHTINPADAPKRRDPAKGGRGQSR